MKVEGKFKYLADSMTKKGMSVTYAANIVQRTPITVRNWLDGFYLKEAIMATSQTQKQAARDVSKLISQITGDSEEVVRDEIRKFLIEQGHLKYDGRI